MKTPRNHGVSLTPAGESYSKSLQ